MENEGDGIGVLQLGYLGFWSIPVVPSSIIMIIKVVTQSLVRGFVLCCQRFGHPTSSDINIFPFI